MWRLVMAEGGEIAWELDDGSRMVLKAEKQEANDEKPQSKDAYLPCIQTLLSQPVVES